MSALVHLGVGLGYLLIGFYSTRDVIGGWRTGLAERQAVFPEGGPRLPFLWHSTDWFGVGLMAMAFSCGPHHVHRAAHVLIEGSPMTGPDLASILFALPFGAAWVIFRTWAVAGGAGDIYVRARGLRLMTLFLMVMTANGAANITAALMERGLDWSHPVLWVALGLAGTYVVVGYYLGDGQNLLREETGRWSLSGLALAGVFPTCAVTHAVYGINVSAGTYVSDWHFLALDGGFGIPAAVWFIWLTRQARGGPSNGLIDALLDPYKGATP